MTHEASWLTLIISVTFKTFTSLSIELYKNCHTASMINKSINAQWKICKNFNFYRFLGAFDDRGLFLNTEGSRVLNGGFSSVPLWKFLVFRLGSWLFSSKCGANSKKSCWKLIKFWKSRQDALHFKGLLASTMATGNMSRNKVPNTVNPDVRLPSSDIPKTCLLRIEASTFQLPANKLSDMIRGSRKASQL